MNLLYETKRKLKENGKRLKDIRAIQGDDFGISVDKFIELANTEYDNGYGSPQVALDLIIIGDDWYLERHNYDGSEWWEYKKLPLVLPINDNICALTINQSKDQDLVGWETLATINEIERDEGY